MSVAIWSKVGSRAVSVAVDHFGKCYMHLNSIHPSGTIIKNTCLDNLSGAIGISEDGQSAIRIKILCRVQPNTVMAVARRSEYFINHGCTLERGGYWYEVHTD